MFNLIERLVAVIFIIFLMPLFVLICISQFFCNGRPVFYISLRCGKNNVQFPVIKFRTMVNDSKFVEDTISEYSLNDVFEKLPISCEVYSDFGRILEKTQLVELPQLLNIILGHMSFVGNRPLPAPLNKKLFDRYGGLVSLRTLCKPGIAGYVQLRGKLNLSDKKRLILEARLARSLSNGNVCDQLCLRFSLFFSVVLSVITRRHVFLFKTKVIGILGKARGFK